MNLLPYELRVQIMRQLSYGDWCRVSGVSKSWDYALRNIWKAYYESIGGLICGEVPDKESPWRKWTIVFKWMNKDLPKNNPIFKNKSLDLTSVPERIALFIKENMSLPIDENTYRATTLDTYSLKLKSEQILATYQRAIAALFCYPATNLDHLTDRFHICRLLHAKLYQPLKREWNLISISDFYFHPFIKSSLKKNFPHLAEITFSEALKQTIDPFVCDALIFEKDTYPLSKLQQIGVCKKSKIYFGYYTKDIWESYRNLIYLIREDGVREYCFAFKISELVCEESNWYPSNALKEKVAHIMYELAIRQNKEDFCFSKDTTSYKKVELESGEIVFSNGKDTISKPSQKILFGEGPLFPRYAKKQLISA